MLCYFGFGRNVLWVEYYIDVAFPQKNIVEMLMLKICGFFLNKMLFVCWYEVGILLKVGA